MRPPSIDIKDLLAGESSLALTYAQNLFVGEMPTVPDDCACVYDSGGYKPDAHIEYKRPTIQIRTRGARGQYQAAHELAQDCADILNGMANVTVSSTRYIGIWSEGDVLFLGMDTNGRPQFSVNLRIHRTGT